MPGAFLPDWFLFGYEFKRIPLNRYGAIRKNINSKHRRLILGMYILIKILVAKILLNPSKTGFSGPVMGKVISMNFKILASILFYVTIDYMDEITNDPKLKD
jgi:uncharacterized membrane protein YcgQ (UPF0703/DUF1980 family)